MNKPIDDTGLLTVLLERFEKQRLPHARALMAKVDRGEPLISFDIVFLQEVAASINELKPFLERHPECNKLATQLMNLCTDITKKGVTIENSR